jgi:hypothetical protein
MPGLFIEIVFTEVLLRMASDSDSPHLQETGIMGMSLLIQREIMFGVRYKFKS